MIQIEGVWWPDDVAEKWKHSLRHVGSLEFAIGRAKRRRAAVQAGGNIGLWPRRMARDFARVITFEPDDVSRACLIRNVPANVEVHAEAIGAGPAVCDIRHRSLGSHQVIAGDRVPVTTIDALGLEDVDLIQLDIEGYEWHALMGAVLTLGRCRPLLQIELRDFTSKYGKSDDEVRRLLASCGYHLVSMQPGNDYVYEYRGC